MLARKDQEEFGKELPTIYKDELLGVLNSVYSDKCKSQRREIEVYGYVYSNEVILATTLVSTVDEGAAPVTFMISCDLDKKSKMDKILNVLVDATGAFFD